MLGISLLAAAAALAIHNDESYLFLEKQIFIERYSYRSELSNSSKNIANYCYHRDCGRYFFDTPEIKRCIENGDCESVGKANEVLKWQLKQLEIIDNGEI